MSPRCTWLQLEEAEPLPPLQVRSCFRVVLQGTEVKISRWSCFQTEKHTESCTKCTKCALIQCLHVTYPYPHVSQHHLGLLHCLCNISVVYCHSFSFKGVRTRKIICMCSVKTQVLEHIFSPKLVGSVDPEASCNIKMLSMSDMVVHKSKAGHTFKFQHSEDRSRFIFECLNPAWST